MAATLNIVLTSGGTGGTGSPGPTPGNQPSPAGPSNQPAGSRNPANVPKSPGQQVSMGVLGHVAPQVAGAVGAAGPWGLIASVIGEKIHQVMNLPQNALNAAKTITGPLAGPTGVSGASIGLAVQGLSKLAGPLGPLVNYFYKVGEAAFDLAESFIARGRQLAKFSPQLAVAGAQADVRSTMGDVKEAQELGPSLARLTDAESELRDLVRDMMLPIRKFVVEELAAFINWVRNTLAGIEALGIAFKDEALPDSVQILVDVFTGEWSWARKHLDELPGKINKAFGDALKAHDQGQKDPDSLMAFWRAMDRPTEGFNQERKARNKTAALEF